MDIRTDDELQEYAEQFQGTPKEHTPLPEWLTNCHEKVRLFATYEDLTYEIPIRYLTETELGISWHTDESNLEGVWNELSNYYTPRYPYVLYESLLDGRIYNKKWEEDMLEFMESYTWWNWIHVFLHAILWVDSELARFEEIFLQSCLEYFDI